MGFMLFPLTLSGKEKGHRLGTSPPERLWKRPRVYEWNSKSNTPESGFLLRTVGGPIEIEAFLSCFCREPWAGSCLHHKNSCLRADSVEDKDRWFNWSQWGWSQGTLWRPETRGWPDYWGQLGSSLLPDPAQEPDSLLRDRDYILDLFASLLLTTVFDT